MGKEKGSVYPGIGKNAPFRFTESFSTLRTNIRFASTQAQTLMVTSAEAREGKSTIALNLATALGSAGFRVLLMDCNLRRPSLKTYLQIYNDVPGLTMALAGKLTAEECILRLEKPGFDFLPAGPVPANPAELIGSLKMYELIQKLSRRYDYILFDTPPVTAVTDAVELSRYTDGVVLVVRHRQTEIATARRAEMMLNNVGAAIIGTVLNAYRPQRHDKAFPVSRCKATDPGYIRGLQSVCVTPARREAFPAHGQADGERSRNTQLQLSAGTLPQAQTG